VARVARRTVLLGRIAVRPPADSCRLPGVRPLPMYTLAELRERYVERGLSLPKRVEAALREDSRAGARGILEAVERMRRARRAEGQRLRYLSRHEQALWQAGHVHVAGVDEAGMSPLAGPVVAGAVVLPVGYVREGVDDSKKLRPEQRDELAAHIRRDA